MIASNSDKSSHAVGEQLSLFDDFDDSLNTDKSSVNNDSLSSSISKVDNQNQNVHEPGENNTSNTSHEFSSTTDFNDWISKLEPTDVDAIALSKLEPSLLTSEQAARLWAKLAAWAQSDQIAYYVDDSPSSSDAAYDTRMRVLSSLESTFPILDTPQSPTHRVGGTFSNDFVSVKHPSRMMSLDDVFSLGAVSYTHLRAHET